MSGYDVWVVLSAQGVEARLSAVDGEAAEPLVSATVPFEEAIDGSLVRFAQRGYVGVERDMSAVLRSFEAALVAVCGEGRGDAVRRLMLNPAVRSVVAIGRENTRLSPALFLGPGADLPEAPSRYLPDTVAREVRRYVSVTAWLVNWLSREWIGLLGRAPLGLPVDVNTGDYLRTRSAWDDARATLTWSPLLVPHGAVMAQVIPMRASVLGLPSFTPVVGWCD